MLKRFITSLFCLFLIFASIPIWGYMQFFSVYVYADSGSGSVGTDWNRVTTNDQTVQSFLAYCKSRDTNIVGGVPNVVANVTYAYLEQLSNSLGIDMNELQAELYYKQEGNKGLQWFMTSTGITYYNQIFAKLISENGFEVGGSADKDLYNGYSYNGNTMYVINTSSLSNGHGASGNSIKQVGTYYVYDFNSILGFFNGGTGTVTKEINLPDGTSYTATYFRASYDGNFIRTESSYQRYSYYYYNAYGTLVTNGHNCLIYNQYDGKSYFGLANEINTNSKRQIWTLKELYNEDIEVVPATVTIISNNIKNEYEGDTYINNEGDVITNNPPGGQDPGWNVGGGQGSYTDGNGDSYTINFPDFELPDLNIDWSISGLGNKFPFSIPFDIVSLVTVLNAEPEAPRFQGTVNFGFTTWDYDINLQQFDTVAQVCRIAELLLLVFGLILITRSIIKG